MNAQQLINETPVNHFDWKVFWKPQSLSKHTNDDRGDKFVARQGNTKYPQVVSEGSITSYPSDFTSLTPRASDILNNININNIKCKAVKQGDVFRELGIEVL